MHYIHWRKGATTIFALHSRSTRNCNLSSCPFCCVPISFSCPSCCLPFLFSCPFCFHVTRLFHSHLLLSSIHPSSSLILRHIVIVLLAVLFLAPPHLFPGQFVEPGLELEVVVETPTTLETILPDLFERDAYGQVHQPAAGAVVQLNRKALLHKLVQ